MITQILNKIYFNINLVCIGMINANDFFKLIVI